MNSSRSILIRFITMFALILSVAGYAQFPYQNTALTPIERVTDLVGRLSLEEKISLMHDASKPIERLGIKNYNWWNEALHGVARAGNATVFPQPIGMAASFDNEAVYRVFTAVSDEARAKNTLFTSLGETGRYQGLTFWTPTINIFRDPRWGRGMESYGEDPYLTSVMGVNVVKALQGPEGYKYDKLHACAKHFAVHSGPEWNRHSFDAKNISLRDLNETYLPAFEALVKEAKVKEVMCAYNRFEGVPCCGSNTLLNDILRNKWGFDGIVVADCGAIADFYKPNAHGTHPDAATASAVAVKASTDLDCGSSYKALTESVQKGYIKESEIDVSVIRLLKARFELGEMDPEENNEWKKIPYSVVCSPEHDSLALMMALKSITLLQNKNKILPLKKSLKIAVIGPNANDSLMQWGNYNGTPKHTTTLVDGIKKYTGEQNLIYLKGCDLVENTLFESVFEQFSNENGSGFTAKYWNNPDKNGNPDVINTVKNPFQFCTSGATVFAPGVNLTDFSAQYTAIFTAKNTDNLYFQFYHNGISSLIIDGKEVWTQKAGHGSRKAEYILKPTVGKTYQVELNFKYFRPDAELNFNVGTKNNIDITSTVKAVKDADVVVFAGGISPFLEGEEMGVNLPGFKRGDRTDIELPYIQRELIKALYEAGKKIVYVNFSGSAIALEPETKHCDAIIQAWYPGQDGGNALAKVIFGDYNPAGKLPVTFYKNTSQLPDFENYAMKGHTYRYMETEALFPFGHGLSYTNFKYRKMSVKTSGNKGQLKASVNVEIQNTGQTDGEEVIQLYLRNPNDLYGPVKTLRAFKRVLIRAGQTTLVRFELNKKQLEWWDEKTKNMAILPGKYELLVGGSSQNDLLIKSKLIVK